jgi:type II secretory pathway component GspD/PulD (secretin)
MIRTTRRRAACLGVGLVWLCSSSVLLADEAQPPSPAATEPQVAFVLTSHDQRVSLDAREASVKAIIEELGRQLHIEVKVSAGAEKTVQVAFAQLPVEEALERLKAAADIDYFIAYQKDVRTQAEKISRIEIVAKGTGTMAQPVKVIPAEGQAEDPAEAPFGFEFDPSKYLNGQSQ